MCLNEHSISTDNLPHGKIGYKVVQNNYKDNLGYKNFFGDALITYYKPGEAVMAKNDFGISVFGSKKSADTFAKWLNTHRSWNKNEIIARVIKVRMTKILRKGDWTFYRRFKNVYECAEIIVIGD